MHAVALLQPDLLSRYNTAGYFILITVVSVELKLS